MSSASEANRGRTRSFFAALGRGDRGALAQLCCGDLEWTVPKGAIAQAGTHVGAAEVFDRMLASTSATFVAGSQRLEIVHEIAEGDVVMVEARFQAQGTNGRDYDNAYVFVFEFEDGRVRRLREHVDTRYAAEFFA
jgi:ketosteroid isomerase-like protein